MTALSLIPWECDVCGRVSTDEPHFPHNPDCRSPDDETAWCDCDNNVCADCCWATQCTEDTP